MHFRLKMLLVALVTALCLTGCGDSKSTGILTQTEGVWVTGDFHNHTFLTDGSHTQQEVLKHAFDMYGLDWLANSEHGGVFGRDPFGNAWDTQEYTLKGDTVDADGNVIRGDTQMWRWQSLREVSFPLLFEGSTGFQEQYPSKVLIQGVEWNVPTHEHASVGIIDQADGKAIAAFEYLFDEKDLDTSLLAQFGEKKNVTHAHAVAAAQYLENTYPDTSYYLINHPSRKQKYTVADIRDFNNAAPDVCFGLEGMPGHQKQPSRGGYGSRFADPGVQSRARTYGGADFMLSQVGGLWDSLLGEGRRFWIFVNSDFHSSADNADFWPGEYAKSYVKVQEENARGIVDGMRSGNVFIVHGDLINALDFSASSGLASKTMGEELTVTGGSDVTVTIRFKSPTANNNGDAVTVDHIDLIIGQVTGRIDPGDADYNNETNATTRILKRFTADDWSVDSEGYTKIVFTLSGLENDSYLRLRGTNLPVGTANETDADGNPLSDDLTAPNTEAKAYADLWFYSNPIFLAIQ